MSDENLGELLRRVTAERDAFRELVETAACEKAKKRARRYPAHVRIGGYRFCVRSTASGLRAEVVA